MTAAPAPDKLGILLRVGLFVILGWLGVMVFPQLMLPLAGIMVTSALSTFAAAAVANAAVVILAGPLVTGAATFEQVSSQAGGIEHRWASFAFVSVVLLFGSAGEEMLFHGYAFQLLIRSLGAFATILPASVLFGLAHLGNQNVTLLGILNTMGWGILLGYAYLRTSALWLPIGLHFGWNFTLPLFGVNLSGFTMGVTGYGLHWRVGELWSGGGYGPEGGLLATAVVVALFFAVRYVTPVR